MQRRHLMAGGIAAAVPPFALAQAVDKPKLTIAVGGKNLFYYLPLTIAEQLGYFKDEGLDVTIVDFAGGSHALRRWSAAAPTWCPALSSTRSTCSSRVSPCAPSCCRVWRRKIVLGVDPDHQRLQNHRRPQGQKNRRDRARQLDQRDGELCAGEGRLEAQRREHRRCGRGQWRRGRHALGPDRCHEQPRPRGHAAAALGDMKIVSDTRIEAVREGIRRHHAGGYLYAPIDYIEKNPHTTQR